MAMDDDTIEKVEKEFRTLTKQIFKANRAQKSSIETVLKGTKSRIEQQKILNQYKKALQENIDMLDETNEEHAERIALYKKEQRETSKLNVAFGLVGAAVDFVAKVFLGFGKAVINTTKMFMDAGERVKTFEQATQHITKELGFLEGGAQALFKSIDFNIENFRTLSKQGADFGQSLFGLRKAAESANLPILDFVDLIQQNSTTFAKFFGTTQSGIPAIAELSRSMRDFTRDELSRFGLTMDDTSEYMTTYLELMRASGRAETMTTGQLIAGSQNYAKELIRLSKLTGQSTDELNSQMEQQKQNGVLNAALAKLAPEEADRLRKLVTALGGAQSAAGGLAVDLIAAGTPITDLSTKLAGTNQSLLQAIEGAVNDPGASLEDTLNQARQASNQFLKDFPQAAAYFQGEFVEILGDASRLAGKATGDAVAGEMQKVIGPESDFTKEVMKTKDTFDRVKVAGEAIVTAFISSPESLQKATEALATVQNKLVKGAESIKDFMKKDEGGGFKSIPEMLDDLGKIFGNVKQKMIDGVKSAFVAIGNSLKNTYTAIKNAIKNGLARAYNAIIKIIPERFRPDEMKLVSDSGAPDQIMGNSTVDGKNLADNFSNMANHRYKSTDLSYDLDAMKAAHYSNRGASSYESTGTAVAGVDSGGYEKAHSIELAKKISEANGELIMTAKKTNALLEKISKNTKNGFLNGPDLITAG
jgi:hypothetical protein